MAKLPPAHYGYLATGTDGNETLSANRRAFEDYYLRPRRAGLVPTLSDQPVANGEDDAGARVTFADFDTSDMTWDYLARIREVTSMQIVVKGIVTREDAASAVDAGADAVYVSNHGGRAEASGWRALESLPEVVEAVGGRVPVMVDSGFRRGTDIFKALALGAGAVCIGRAYIWGLAAFGQPGVEKVLEMLKAELSMVMSQVGATSIHGISASHIGKRKGI